MLKYTVKLLLRAAKEKDNGHIPIYLRLTIAGQSSFISTGHAVPLNMWDEKKERVKDGFLLASVINPDITTRKQTVIKRLAEIQVAGGTITAAQAKLLFAGADLRNIFDFVEAYSAEVKHKREEGTLENYRKHIKVLEDFHGSRNLTFQEINHSYLVKFEAYLRARAKGDGQLLGGNYIFAIFKTLKTFFNAARKRGLISHYPFEAYESPEYKAPGKDYLTLAELDKMEQFLESKNYVVYQTVLYYLLGCYSALRISDWYRFSYKTHVKDQRLQLWTKKNGEWVTMKIMGRLAKILELVRDTPLTITEQEINRTLKDLAKDAEINKKLSTHTARHTFAITMCADQDISAETCAELMGITLKTCVENYYKVTNRKIDKETGRAWEGL